MHEIDYSAGKRDRGKKKKKKKKKAWVNKTRFIIPGIYKCEVVNKDGIYRVSRGEFNVIVIPQGGQK